MKSYLYQLVSVFSILLASFSTEVMAQEQKPLDLNELAAQEADRLQKLLDLEDWQVFYVDSTLQVNYSKLQKEMESLQKSKVSNTSIYQEARDKFMDNLDAAYRKFFTDEQWAAYLKSGAAKQQKQRAKRREKAGK